MVRKVCLDTDVLISLFKKDEATKNLIENLRDCSFSITSINVFDLWLGRKKQEQTSELIESLEVFDFDKNSAKIAADIVENLGNALELFESINEALAE